DYDLAIDTLEWIKKLVDGEIGSPSHELGTAISAFATGSTAMFYGGVWVTAGYQDGGLAFDVTMVPNIFGTQAAHADSHSFVLPFQENRDPEARRQVHEFVASVLHNSISWAGAGH